MNNVGCGKVSSYEEIAKEKLYERYQDDFEIENVQSHHFLSGYYTVIAYPQSDPTLLFRASINDDGSEESDNYVCTLVCQRLSEQVEKNLNALNGFYYVYSKPRIDTVNIQNKEMSVREYVQEFPSCAFRTYLFYCPETFDAEAFAFNIQQAFNGLEFIEGKIDMYFVPDEDSLGKIQNYLETHDQMYDEFKDIADSYYKGSIEFKFGSWSMSLEEIQEMVR